MIASSWGGTAIEVGTLPLVDTRRKFGQPTLQSALYLYLYCISRPCIHRSNMGSVLKVWMTPESLSACGEGESAETLAARMAVAATQNPDPGLSYLKPRTAEVLGGCTTPNVPSTLWNSMIAPFLPFKMAGFLWYQGKFESDFHNVLRVYVCTCRMIPTNCLYAPVNPCTPFGSSVWCQGESNAGAPERYAKCFPAKISHWRTDFKVAADTPYFFAQIAPWPNHNIGDISGIRYAQTAALELPGVGMAVTADIGDPGEWCAATGVTFSSYAYFYRRCVRGVCSRCLSSDPSAVQTGIGPSCRTHCGESSLW
jgi:hypothetical protein